MNVDFSFETEGLHTLTSTDIGIPPRLRTVNGDYADWLAQSFAERGQMQPIEVVRNPDTTAIRPIYLLISGAHRLAASEATGTVVAKVVKYTGKMELFERACRLREVDENLIRQELNPLDRAIFLHTRKVIYEELHPETKAGVAGGKARQDSATDIVSFAKDTAIRLGISDRTIQRACMIAERISPEIRAKISGTPVSEKQSELLSLAKQGPDAQDKIVEALLNVEARVKSVAAAIRYISGTKATDTGGMDPTEAAFRSLLNAFRKSPAKAQRQFIAFLKVSGDLNDIDDLVAEYYPEG